uniref:Secreted protein n=1 Tax=Mesocestoides corti TaxID=53468 RepID=A0A5K3G2W4_MESCO
MRLRITPTPLLMPSCTLLFLPSAHPHAHEDRGHLTSRSSGLGRSRGHDVSRWDAWSIHTHPLPQPPPMHQVLPRRPQPLLLYCSCTASLASTTSHAAARAFVVATRYAGRRAGEQATW